MISVGIRNALHIIRNNTLKALRKMALDGLLEYSRCGLKANNVVRDYT